jgi:hypothetical protein
MEPMNVTRDGPNTRIWLCSDTSHPPSYETWTTVARGTLEPTADGWKATTT